MKGESIPESSVTEIIENGIRYLVDVENGQKTGFFLDQKYNRAAVARISKNRNVLDCFPGLKGVEKRMFLHLAVTLPLIANQLVENLTIKSGVL